PLTTLSNQGRQSTIASCRAEVRFQLDQGPLAIIKQITPIRGKKKKLQYRGPTEIVPQPKASAIKGYKVPSRTVIMTTTSRILLLSKRVSRDNQLKLGILLTTGARKA